MSGLLPVHFNGDKIFVEQLGDFGVLKALPGHHMAPVAGAVADAEKDRLVLLLGFLKGLRPQGYQSTGCWACCNR